MELPRVRMDVIHAHPLPKPLNSVIVACDVGFTVWHNGLASVKQNLHHECPGILFRMNATRERLTKYHLSSALRTLRKLIGSQFSGHIELRDKMIGGSSVD